MIRQRPEDAAPAPQSAAENLPITDAKVDVAMALVTIHHWRDWRTELREMQRVARQRRADLDDVSRLRRNAPPLHTDNIDVGLRLIIGSEQDTHRQLRFPAGWHSSRLRPQRVPRRE